MSRQGNVVRAMSEMLSYTIPTMGMRNNNVIVVDFKKSTSKCKLTSLWRKDWKCSKRTNPIGE